MSLKSQEQQQLEYSTAVKLFIESPAFTDYVWPEVMRVINAEFPKPDTEGWETKYIHAFTLVESAKALNSTLQNMAAQAEYLRKKQTQEEPDIDLA